MTKELVICIIIIILIFAGNAITQGYLNKSITVITENLKGLKEQIVKEEINTESAKNEIENIYYNWEERNKKLSYYVEHNELEKVNNGLTGLKAYIEMEEVSEAIPELERTIFVLEHIKNKYIVNLRNIF